MESRRLEAFLDEYARTMIANEHGLLYDAIECDFSNCFLDILQTLDEQTRPSHEADANSRTRN
jgi:hypothetical protein